MGGSVKWFTCVAFIVCQNLRTAEHSETKILAGNIRNEYHDEQETADSNNCSPETCNVWQLMKPNAVVTVTPRFMYAMAPFHIPTPDDVEGKDHNLLLVIHGGYIPREGGMKISNTTDFFDIDAQTWISPHVQVEGNVRLAAAMHSAASFPNLPGSPVVFYGGVANIDDAIGRQGCQGEVVMLRSEFGSDEGRNRLTFREGQTGPRRCFHSAVAVGSDMVVFGGTETGDSETSMPTNEIYLYSPLNNTWTRREPKYNVPSRRRGAVAVALDDKCMIVVGGTSRSLFGAKVLRDVHLYNVSDDTLRKLKDVPVSYLFQVGTFQAAFFKNGNYGHLLTMQWQRFQGIAFNVYQFDLTGNPAKGVWTSTRTDLLTPAPEDRATPSLTTVVFKGKNRAYLFGGVPLTRKSQSYPFSAHFSSDLWYLQGHSNCYAWTEMSPLTRSPGKVYGHTMTALDDSVFVFGGYIQQLMFGSNMAIPDMWRIQPQRGQQSLWEQYRSLLQSKKSLLGHSTVAIKAENGMSCLLTYGGYTIDDYGHVEVSSQVIRVCPQQFHWRLYPQPPSPRPPSRLLHTAVVHEGTMYIFGGLQSINTLRNNALDDLWCLENIHSFVGLRSVSGSVVWKQRPFLNDHPTHRFGHSSLLVNNNTGMVVFGGTDGQSVLDDIWIYTFTTNAWVRLVYSATPSIKSTEGTLGRFGHTAVVVGKHLIVHGGCTQPPPYNYSFHLVRQNWQPLPSCKEAGRSRSTIYLNLETREWNILETENGIPLLYHQAVLLDNDIYVYGGLRLDNYTSDDLFILRPSCNPGQYGFIVGLGCSDCPIGTYSKESGPSCNPCSPFFTTNETGSRSEESCSICKDACYNGGSCIVRRPNYRYECDCPSLFSGPTCANFGPVLGLVAGVTGGLLLLYLIFRLIKYFRRVRQDASIIRERNAYIGDFIEGGKIQERELRFIRNLGEGAYGEVKLAEYREIYVAVKILHQGPTRPMMGSDTGQKFEQEIDFMRRTRHENIVLFMGWGVTSTGGLFLVTEYMKRGSLQQVLQNSRGSLQYRRKLEFARDAAEGMKFLHLRGRIHRDLKSANLLVSRNWMVKVADFGSARTLYNLGVSEERDQIDRHYRVSEMDYEGNSDSEDENETSLLRTNYGLMTRRVGTLLYNAPEILVRQAYGAAIDVYSFGIVMWEIYTCLSPYEGRTLPEHYDDFVSMICTQRVRPIIPAACPQLWRDLMTECWSDDSSNRPMFREVARRLGNMLNQ